MRELMRYLANQSKQLRSQQKGINRLVRKNKRLKILLAKRDEEISILSKLVEADISTQSNSYEEAQV